ncbi:MAG: hypothetical protein R6T87_08920 [Marinobacter sp.]
MKSVILMFVGGLVGGVIGPVAALVCATAGFFIGRWDIESARNTHSAEHCADAPPKKASR